MFLFIRFRGYEIIQFPRMSIQSICSNAPVLRILFQTQRLKWSPPSNKNFLCSSKLFQSSCEPTSRIIYGHSSIKSCSYDIQETEKEQPSFYLRQNFLKENFNIEDSRYFKLVIVPSECNCLEELLWTNEFKTILSRSPFLYDVNVIENSKNFIMETSDCQQHVYEDMYSYENYSVSKQSVNAFDAVFMSNSELKENIKGKASEQQLLHVIDRLIYSLINFFEKPHDYSIYNKNIVFQNNIKGVTIKGLKAYIQSMYLMKFYGFLHFAKVKVEILKVTHHVEDGSIRVRWRVNGLPRHKLIFMLWKHKVINWQLLPEEETEWLDGFSVFSVGEDGLIYMHVCDKMIPDDEQLLSKNVDLRSKVLGLLGLTPRGHAAGSLNTLIPCCRNQDLLSCKKLT